MKSLILNDGTVIENVSVLDLDDTLYIAIIDRTDMGPYFTLFGDPEKTGHMHTDVFGFIQEYDGYTDFYSISKENGNVNVVLRKAAA